MIKRTLNLVLFFFAFAPVFAQNCDCKANYAWVKKTFEENDAGFSYALEQKGKQAYQEHNTRIEEKVKNAGTISECTPLLYEWLSFFRSGHIAISLNRQAQKTANKSTEKKFPDWESYAIKTAAFKKQLDQQADPAYEGIWETEPYTIGIKKEGDDYIGFIIESGVESWTEGQVKLKFSIKDKEASSVFYLRDHSPVSSGTVKLTGKNHLQIGDFMLTRSYPKLEDGPEYARYFKALDAQEPYLEKWNENTLYLRIPSFSDNYKKGIDNVLKTNHEQILSTKNLIIDIRNNGGGSDASYAEIIPYLYTNPIRTTGVEYLSTGLNNQRMLDFINKPEYGFDEEGKKWAKASYELLQSKLGQFVNLNEDRVSVGKLDTIYPYPQQVGIIMNEQNGSTAEQFLLECKQSKKVKLFGVTSFGVLDISNMYFVDSPCKEFQLGYSLSRSMRIPDFIIDERGIQPDYYIDPSIPQQEWTDYVIEVFNGQ